jgi:pimeloyl-ACP methyl ester carboxylesterase
MTTFALVHGAWHGAWCWERLLAPLEARGHGAVAVDLPAEDLDAGLDEYADLVAAFLAPVADDAIVVGHSLNGLILPLVAARRPVSAIVYLCALVPLEGKSLGDQLSASTLPILTFGERPERDGDGRSYWPPERARGALYPDLAEEDAAWAAAQLRPQAPTSQKQPHPAGLPPVRAVSIIGAHDAALNPEWSRVVAAERLGTAPVELATGHFPMIAAPEALADALDAVSSGP